MDHAAHPSGDRFLQQASDATNGHVAGLAGFWKLGADVDVLAGRVEGGPDPAMRNSQHTGLGGVQGQGPSRTQLPEARQPVNLAGGGIGSLLQKAVACVRS